MRPIFIILKRGIGYEDRKKEGEPPEVMKTLYEILHRKHIEHADAVKGMLALYKEQ